MDAFNGHKGVFNFRIDLDYFFPPHVKNVLETSEKHGVKMTWFINTKSAQHYPELIKRIAETQDVQNHGHVHKAFDDFESNYDNIIRADKVLRAAGIKAVGFSSPYGKWSRGLAEALEKARYTYSSEFRHGRVFPFYPEGRTTLQVPIHPVCEDDLFMRGYTIAQVKDYFTKIIGLSYKARIPIFLYGHPTYRLGKYRDILEHVFAEVKKKDVHATTLTDFARFWIRKKPLVEEKKDINEVLLKKKHNYAVYLKNYVNYLLLGFRRKLTGIDNV